MNLFQKPIDSTIQLTKIASKNCSTRTTNNKQTEIKELEIERLYTVVYTGSLQTRATSSLLRNPEDIH